MKRLKLNTPLVVGLVILSGLVFCLIAPLILPMRAPDAMRQAVELNGLVKPPPYSPGVAGFILGTDHAGRDILSRLMHGARFTLGLALGVCVIRALVAIPLGLLAGWYRSWLAAAVKTLAAGTGVLPTLVLVTLILWGLQSGAGVGEVWIWIYFGVVTAVGLPRLAEQVRRLAVGIIQAPHIEAAVATGATPWRILRRHVWPIMQGDLWVSLAAEVGWVLVMMAHLAILDIFVGGNVVIPRDPPLAPVVLERLPEWGQMLGANLQFLRTNHWWPALFPALALGLTVAGFQFLAEGLRRRQHRSG